MDEKPKRCYILYWTSSERLNGFLFVFAPNSTLLAAAPTGTLSWCSCFCYMMQSTTHFWEAFFSVFCVSALSNPFAFRRASASRVFLFCFFSCPSTKTEKVRVTGNFSVHEQPGFHITVNFCVDYKDIRCCWWYSGLKWWKRTGVMMIFSDRVLIHFSSWLLFFFFSGASNYSRRGWKTHKILLVSNSLPGSDQLDRSAEKRFGVNIMMSGGWLTYEFLAGIPPCTISQSATFPDLLILHTATFCKAQQSWDSGIPRLKDRGRVSSNSRSITARKTGGSPGQINSGNKQE